MKAIVVYYTQTGNTKRIAQAICSGIKHAGGDCDIARLRDINPKCDLIAYDLIGLGSPVINFREPPNVTEFIGSMKGVDGKHGFAFCTHGALPARFMAEVVPAMIQRGIVVLGWNDWFGSVMYPLVPKPYFTDGHPDVLDLEEAEAFGREMVERARAVLAGDTRRIPALPKGKDYDDLYDPVPSPDRSYYVRVKARIEFRINPERCNYPRCTHCADNCPTNSIDFSVVPPVFNRNCFLCFLCEQICPRGAIEVDWLPVQQAHDPLVTSWLQKSLEVFEQKGRFRRLVPLSQIGWQTPVWRLPRPRFKVER